MHIHPREPIELKELFNFKARNIPLRFLITIGLLFTTTHTAIANDTVDNSEWQFAADIYLWSADLNGTAFDGHNFEIPFHDSLGILDMAFMGSIGARKDKLNLLFP